jgi:hypothetical protein
MDKLIDALANALNAYANNLNAQTDAHKKALPGALKFIGLMEKVIDKLDPIADKALDRLVKDAEEVLNAQ